MRFSVAAAAVLATAVTAYDYGVVYETVKTTITSCAPEYTDCPAHSTVVKTTSYPVVTSYPVATSSATYHNSSSVYVPVYPPASVVTSEGSYETPKSVYPPHVPTGGEGYHSIVTISTCVPTVIYSTVTVKPSPTPAPPAPPAYVPSPPAYAPGPPSNATTPIPTGGAYPSKPVTYTGAASSVQMSAFAAALGLAAFVLA